MDLTARGKNLLDYWAILTRRRWIIYLTVVAATLIAVIGSFMLTPLYRATATLQIERQNPDILTFKDLGRMDYSWAAYSDFYQTEYRIIASKAVARKAVEQLGLTSHPLFSPKDSKPGLLARIRSLIPRRGTAVESDPTDRAAGRLLANLEVSPVRNSHLVQVSWISPDPALAAEVANTITSAYIQFNIAAQFSASGEAEGFLADQIGTLKNEIATIEERLQQYGESKRIVSVDDSNNITLQALKDISEQRTAAQATLAKAEATYRAARDNPPQALPEVLNSSLIARLREEYATYEAEYSLKSRQFKDSWPEMQTLKSKLDQAKLRLDLETEQIAMQVEASAEAAYRKALNEVANLDRLLKQQEGAAQNLRRDAVEYTNLQSEVQKKRETLDTLLRRQNEMALTTRLQDLEATSTNIRIMEPATTPAAPYRPNTKANVMLGIMLGLGLGVGMAFLVDYLDNTISSTGELEKLVSLPVLAVVPRHSEEGSAAPRSRRKKGIETVRELDLAAHLDSRSGASEAYRELRTSILLSGAGKPPERIIITSPLPGEGKTVTAINLAIVLAQLGRRVLLVDADLRKPRLHAAFETPNRRGLSTFLSGLEQNPDELVTPTCVDNLSLMTSGPIPPNPSELLNSPLFAELSGHFLAHGYDHIVFDSPPVLSVSDPVIVSQAVDLGILVIRAGLTPKNSIRLAAGKLQKVGISQFGILLNDIDTESHGSLYQRYHYYGRYGESEDEKQTETASLSNDG